MPQGMKLSWAHSWSYLRVVRRSSVSNGLLGWDPVFLTPTLVLWTIWKDRNQRIFRNGENSVAGWGGFGGGKSPLFSCWVVRLVLCLDDRSVHLGVGLCATCACKTLFLLFIYMLAIFFRSFKKKFIRMTFLFLFYETPYFSFFAISVKLKMRHEI